jgi:sugar phosphate isomerase/epimerase
MLLLATDSLKGYGLNRIFAFAKEAGYQGIEVSLDTRDFDTQNAEYLNTLQKETGLHIKVIRTFSSANSRKTLQAVELAHAVGAKTVVLEPPKIFDFTYKNWLKNEVPKLRKKYGVKIALKNGPAEYVWGFVPGRSMNSIPDLQKFKEVCLDTSYLYGKKLDLMRAYDLVKKYLEHVHISQVRAGKEHCFPTDGVMPLESLLTKLTKDKFEGFVSVLVTPKEMMVGKDESVLKQLEKARKFYEKYS